MAAGVSQLTRAAVASRRHWWARLTAADLTSHQLPDPVGPYRRPAGW